ncbi:hypothetical protein DJ61_2566 [Yersinia enterocolitica]|nr:hypothetical protein DJ61_2566 [Yersinia enterocolitica]
MKVSTLGIDLAKMFSSFMVSAATVKLFLRETHPR